MRFRIRHTPSLIGFIAVIILFLLFSFADSQYIPTGRNTVIIAPSPSPSTIVQYPSRTPTPDVLADATGIYRVTKVVDGDTIRVLFNGKSQTVRLIGINTPETVDPRKEVECFGKEASLFARQLMEGKEVRLEADPSQGDRDRYNRILRYVFLIDGQFVNKVLIEEGFAYEYTYDEPYLYQASFKETQTKARTAMKGLWGAGGCGG